jgi:hypothetical protein
MVGGVVTMAGLVLLVQNATDRFETWAYAWTLVLLVGSGVGRWLLGAVGGRRRYHLKLWMGFPDESAAYLPA